jgi:3-methylfumaryl-CoA hydratase
MTEVARLTKVPTTVAMFRFSAVMWNAHRVHFDQAYAVQVEGHAGLLVPAYLLSAYLFELVTGWAGPRGRVTRLTYQTRASVHQDAQLSVWARQVGVTPGPDGDLVELEIGIDDADGRTPVVGTAQVRRAPGDPAPSPS